MSNLEKHPEILTLGAAQGTGFTVLDPQEVRSEDDMSFVLSRTLPHESIGMIGPWCYVDHFAPQGVEVTGGLEAPRHPHAGMATMTMLFSGEIEQTDSTGASCITKPGDANLLIAGRGATHSEHTTEDTDILQGVELWYALPDKHRFTPPSHQHHDAECFYVGDCKVSVYLGALSEQRSPIDPIVSVVAAQLEIYGESEITIDEHFEHGLLVDSGEVEIALDSGVKATLYSEQLAYIPDGTASIALSAEVPTRLVLFGGQPFDEDILMWWNFVARSREDVEQLRTEYINEVRSDYEDDTIFGPFPEDSPAPAHAPDLPEED